MSRLDTRGRLCRSVASIHIAITIALWSVEVVLADIGALPVRPPAPALLPGVAKLLGITQLEAAGSALERPFSDPIELKLEAGIEPLHQTQTPPHCRALLDLEARITGTKSAADWNLLQQRLADCHALQWLAGWKAPSQTALPAHLLAARKTRLWPASTWPAVSPDESEALVRPGQTLQSASGRRYWQSVPRDTTGFAALQLDSQGYTLRVQWLARGDFDGDGWEDWLLRWQAQAVGGTWRASSSLLLTRKTPGRAFSVRALGSQP
jgi:hypothetical protein